MNHKIALCVILLSCNPVVADCVTPPVTPPPVTPPPPVVTLQLAAPQLFASWPLQAAPFLSCANYPVSAMQPRDYLVKIDTNPEVSVPAVDAPSSGGSKRLLFDLSNHMRFGKHTVSVRAKSGATVSAPGTMSYSVGMMKGALIVSP